MGGAETLKCDEVRSNSLEKVDVAFLHQAIVHVPRCESDRYLILGVALVAGWEGGCFFLEGFAPNGVEGGESCGEKEEHLR